MSPRTKFIYEEFPEGAKHSWTKADTNTQCNPFVSFFKVKLEERSEVQKSLYKNQGNNIAQGEVVLDDFSCAANLKILIQGVLYVSN